MLGAGMSASVCWGGGGGCFLGSPWPERRLTAGRDTVLITEYSWPPGRRDRGQHGRGCQRETERNAEREEIKRQFTHNINRAAPRRQTASVMIAGIVGNAATRCNTRQ